MTRGTENLHRHHKLNKTEQKLPAAKSKPNAPEQQHKSNSGADYHPDLKCKGKFPRRAKLSGTLVLSETFLSEDARPFTVQMVTHFQPNAFPKNPAVVFSREQSTLRRNTQSSTLSSCGKEINHKIEILLPSKASHISKVVEGEINGQNSTELPIEVNQLRQIHLYSARVIDKASQSQMSLKLM